MDYDTGTMSTVDLQRACKARGLPTYGTKQQLKARLDAAPVITPQDTAAKILAPTAEDTKVFSAPTVSTNERQELLEALQRQYAGLMVVSYDADQDVYRFDGGAQGRTTTTGKQPAKAIQRVAASYVNISQGAALHASLPQGALGNVG